MQEPHDVIVAKHSIVWRAVVYPVESSRLGILLIGSGAHRLNQPFGVYEELALYLQSAGINTVRFNLRAPQLFVPTVLDLCAVVETMRERGVEQVALVVEAATHRSAAFAPIAYRSVASLVGVVVGVATILPVGGNDTGEIPHNLPSDLRFLLRAAAPHSGDPSFPFARAVARPEGLSELYLAPGHLPTRAAAMRSVMTPLYSWAKRMLLEEPAETAPSSPGQGTERSVTGEADSAPSDSARSAQLKLVPAMRSRPNCGRVQAAYREVWAWLAEEWQRIVREQALRQPERALPLDFPLSVGADIHLSSALHRHVASQRHHLDLQGRNAWIEAYTQASRLVAELTSGANFPRDAGDIA